MEKIHTSQLLSISQIQETEGTLTGAVQLHGKELSYNNIGDTDGALETLKEFEEPTVVAQNTQSLWCW